VNGFVTGFQPVFDERKQDAIFLLVVVEKRANVPRFSQVGAGKGNGC
jgi:hypothetical protein